MAAIGDNCSPPSGVTVTDGGGPSVVSGECQWGGGMPWRYGQPPGGPPRSSVVPLLVPVTWLLNRPLADLGWSVVRMCLREVFLLLMVWWAWLSENMVTEQRLSLAYLTSQPIVLLSCSVSAGQVNRHTRVVVSFRARKEKVSPKQG